MTKFQAGTILKTHVMDCQVHAIGKAIRPLFADQVTYIIMTGEPMHTVKEKTPCLLALSIII